MPMFSTIVRQRVIVLTLFASILSGCANLPSSGPTAREVVKGARDGTANVSFQIVDLNAASVAALNLADTHRASSEATFSTLAANSRSDLVGPGDVLAISVYEVGVSLFAGGGPRAVTGGFDPSAHSETFPAVAVDGRGEIHLPFVGPLMVEGLTPDQIQATIEESLRGKSQDPKALVAIRQNISNTVYVSGDVRRPGRLELTMDRERLLDAIAISGGAAFTSDDTIVRFSRGGRILEQRLSTIRSGTADDLTLNPGDRIELIKRPRTYVSFGATGRVSQIAFETGDLSLAEAIARMGGPNDAMADASAVFLFRYETAAGPTGNTERGPVAYRLNLLNPGSYFLSQHVSVRDKDVIYVANAATNRPSKLVAIINQLFSPAIAVRQLAP